MTQVLVVDDERSMRISVREFLVDAGYEVEVAADAREALQAFESRDFDVVVSDIVLPLISGIELLKTISSAAPFSQVIMITGEPSVDSAAEALRAGAFDYLTKPVTKNAILRAVGNAARVKTLDDERRRLEEENHRYRQDLERLVEERTGELRDSNLQLKTALDELREAQDEMVRHERLNALAQLAAGICHDFNNVLMPIRGLANFLFSHPEQLEDKHEALRILGHIREATDDAKEIVRRMQEFYRPGEIVEMETLGVVGLLNDVVELTRPKWETQSQSEGRSVRMVCDPASVRKITGNASQLREALTNLVLNAADAMPRGGTITLWAKQSDQCVEVGVTDTGEGMPEEIRNRCLEPFFTTKGESGTGMGLAMVHGIVNRHNGMLEVESEMGKGTTVRIRLPLVKPGDEEQLRADRKLNERRKSLRVLVIDDEQRSRDLIARYLREAGHSVVLAQDGTAGIVEASGTKFDIVVTDHAMPGMNGGRVAAALKEMDPDIPVLLLTGYTLGAGKDAVPGVDGILEKPVTQAEVFDMVDKLTARGENGTES